MKILDKIGLTIFSTMVLLIAIVVCCVIFGWLDTEIILEIMDMIIKSRVASNITLGVSIILILLAIKCIFFNSYSREQMKGKEGIVLENDNGKLLVSKDTIENLTNTVVKSFDSAESVMTKVELDRENNIRIYITLFVNPDAIIKDLTAKLQANIKATIKRSLDFDVKEVNIRIKNISPKKETIKTTSIKE